MNRTCKIAGTACLAVLLAACSNRAMIQSTHPHTFLTVKGHAATQLPTDLDLSTTTFGAYEFEATEDGHAPMYGVLPLDFQGGNLTLDILFFMPAIWFNMRGAYEHYQVDVAHGVIRYRNDADEPWKTYRPTSEDIADARGHFGASTRALASPAPETASTPSTTQGGQAAPVDRDNCDTRRTGIICPDDPSRHVPSH